MFPVTGSSQQSLFHYNGFGRPAHEDNLQMLYFNIHYLLTIDWFIGRKQSKEILYISRCNSPFECLSTNTCVIIYLFLESWGRSSLQESRYWKLDCQCYYWRSKSIWKSISKSPITGSVVVKWSHHRKQNPEERH